MKKNMPRNSLEFGNVLLLIDFLSSKYKQLLYFFFSEVLHSGETKDIDFMILVKSRT